MLQYQQYITMYSKLLQFCYILVQIVQYPSSIAQYCDLVNHQYSHCKSNVCHIVTYYQSYVTMWCLISHNIRCNITQYQ